MVVNAAELLAKVRQRKKELQSWQWWDTKVGPHIYHPRDPNHGDSSAPAELYLTPEERKRQRKLDTLIKQEDQRKRIKLGIEKAPGPKLKMKNVHAVFGPAYTQDPTKYELMAKQAQDERHQSHLQQNEARKVSAEARWQRHQEKVHADRESRLCCAAFQTPPLGSKEQYIVDYTAKKLAITGALLLNEQDAYLVMEGGAPQISKCEKLMITKMNSKLLWKGELPKANFSRWSVHSLPDRAGFLKVYGVESIFDSL